MIIDKISSRGKFIVLALMVLIVARLAIVILTINNVPPTDQMASGAWFFNGGDGDGYFASAKAFLNWEFISGGQPIGLALFYAPLIFLTGAEALSEIIILMTIVYAVLFNILATILCYILAKKFLASAAKALAVAAVFQIYPYFFYGFFYFFGGSSETMARFLYSRFLHLQFLYIGSDALAMLLTLGSLLVLFKVAGQKSAGAKNPLILGILTGWAVITRLQNIILLPVYAVILLWQKQYRALIFYSIGALPFGLLQAYANWAANGSVFSTAYGADTPVGQVAPVFSFLHPLRLITYPLKYNPWLFLPLVIMIILLIIGTGQAIKQHGQSAIILSLYCYGMIGFLLLLWPSYMNPRYFLPVIPILFIYFFVSLAWIISFSIKYGRATN
ncbi:hypothetical protein COX22_00050 [Candidatus Falkowbacteria bacterium CG23_combo_of_CG06-09_8_20_14_all_49_15]|uniref:Glycosyltransferase RgtA/B/C/D-like domain-containing protein n=1 Tax=Candidatus Falkowbacteria bacterium CG23_combo_of_CG06-09_8_20_14_all_49_15 TaxID=1974572 RepID=A0A2G9ZM32_9BACT|nr:MAG: hypothetical protein COX22_00050 [Candidatus Falkowbacteria bacterium CG23_combo_of_CG06-09_8_20_14_all_49_15]